MSKERLEEIKEQVKYLQGDLMRDDLGWLIEQTERVQELENILDQDHRQEVLESMYEQNKRYRNAIENVLEIENYGVATDYIKTVTNILLEALEEHK